MRLIGIVVGGVLTMAVIAQGAYIFRTRSQLADVTQRLEQLGQDRDQVFARGSEGPTGGRDVSLDDEPAGPPPTRRLPPPRLVQQGTPTDSLPAPRSNDPLPLPPGIDSPQAREQLRQFVLAQLQREREEARHRQDEVRQQREQERRDQMAKQLGLSPSETERFNQILNDSRVARDKLREQVQGGEMGGDGVRQAMMALRDQNNQQLRGLLGEDRMKKFESLQPAGPGGRGGPGGGRWGGGSPGGGPGAGPGGPGFGPGAAR